jgi:hypothetical protein
MTPVSDPLTALLNAHACCSSPWVGGGGGVGWGGGSGGVGGVKGVANISDCTPNVRNIFNSQLQRDFIGRTYTTTL